MINMINGGNKPLIPHSSSWEAPPWPLWKCDATALVVSHDSGAHTGPKDPGPTGATWAPVQFPWMDGFIEKICIISIAHSHEKCDNSFLLVTLIPTLL